MFQNNIPTLKQLGEAYPNPFNPCTSFAVNLSKDLGVNLSVFDMRGRRIAVLYQGHLNGGIHHFEWNGKDTTEQSVASGCYTIRLVTEDGIESQAVLLLR